MRIAWRIIYTTRILACISTIASEISRETLHCFMIMNCMILLFWFERSASREICHDVEETWKDLLGIRRNSLDDDPCDDTECLPDQRFCLSSVFFSLGQSNRSRNGIAVENSDGSFRKLADYPNALNRSAINPYSTFSPFVMNNGFSPRLAEQF